MADSDFVIPAVPRRVQYTATASQTVFPIPFRFFQDSDVKVKINSSLTAVSPSEYTITGAGENNDGELTFDTGQTGGDLITIYSESAIQRTTNFQNSGEWTAANVNDEFNRLTTFIQEVALKSTDLSVTLPITTQLAGLTFPDDGASGNADKVIMWNPAGTALINGPSLSGLVTVSDNIASVIIVADDLAGDDDIGTVASNIGDVTICADNIASILLAPDYADDAEDARDEALVILAQMQSLYDNFDDRYLGSKVSDPAVDNDGDPLIDGALYFNTTSNLMRIYDLGNTTWNNVTTALADGSVTTAKIADLAVTFGKMATSTLATASNYLSNTASKILTVASVWESAEYVALTDDGTDISIDLNTGIHFSFTMDDDLSLENPTNGKEGQTGFIQFTQDGSGGRVLSFDTAYVGTEIILLSTTAGAVDLVGYHVLPSGDVLITGIKKDVG